MQLEKCLYATIAQENLSWCIFFPWTFITSRYSCCIVFLYVLKWLDCLNQSYFTKLTKKVGEGCIMIQRPA